ncbi:MAG TPA: protein translocase subunit SecF [Vicinamibacterales bacterium]|jgi:preprotein translocase subunit SecF|nr:protein translocase subunit SecF [Vicinamibacterales bacterium]
MHIFKNPHYDFVRWRWYAIAVSWVIIIAGLVFINTKGMPKGVEFEGGTTVIVKFQNPTHIDTVRTALETGVADGTNAIVQSYGAAGQNEVMMRLRTSGSESANSLTSTADQVVAALNKAGLGPIAGQCPNQTATNCVAGTEIVGPTVGADLTRRGTLATVFALAGILVYVALRFQLSFAVGAVVATLHDLLITLAFLAFFNYELSLNVIAAILTITGYSMNDTIVIFDRVRENMRSMRRDNLAHIVNTSVNQMLDRTLITGGTTMLSVIALYLFGGEVLKAFAFTMIVGIITGTYSSVFIAAAIVVIWQGFRKPKTAPAAVAPASTPARKSRRRAS